MSTVKELINALLEQIYGSYTPLNTPSRASSLLEQKRGARCGNYNLREERQLAMLSAHRLVELRAILRVEMRLLARLLERRLLTRDKHRRYQDLLCRFINAILYVTCSKLHFGSTINTSL